MKPHEKHDVDFLVGLLSLITFTVLVFFVGLPLLKNTIQAKNLASLLPRNE